MYIGDHDDLSHVTRFDFSERNARDTAAIARRLF